MTTELIFHETKFDVIDRDGQPWVRSPQIEGALGFTKKDAVQQLYSRHADEFTDNMTAVVKLQTSGGLQDVRIFSLRGCHLLAMFAKTPVAKEFRKWVLDVLDREQAAQTSIAQTKEALPEPTITPPQQRHLHDIVNARVADIPKDQTRQAYKFVWGTFNKHFGIARYSQLPQSKIADAEAFLRSLTIPVKFETTEDAPESGQAATPSEIHITKEAMDAWYKERIEKEKVAMKEAIDAMIASTEKVANRLRIIRNFSMLLR